MTTEKSQSFTIPENDNGDEDTLLCDMSWVQIREMADVQRLCFRVLQRMREMREAQRT